jgi:hypothetical protein
MTFIQQSLALISAANIHKARSSKLELQNAFTLKGRNEEIKPNENLHQLKSRYTSRFHGELLPPLQVRNHFEF